ncbi:dipeptidyl peptidase [Acrasis kona]|uniref:Dipeptidyl peptidase 1 n=1 Tax=Acrasis kona TaxID=1008807 RepID=A0AAW2ZGZ3_9EUKA
MKTILFAVFFFALALSAFADLPTHCVIDQVLGEWTFSLTKDTYDNTVVKKYPLDSTPEFTETLKVTLAEPDVATLADGTKGRWTLIYDEGFDIFVGNKIYFAFFNYTKSGSVVTSHCDRTFTGWYHDDQVGAKNWGAFRGVKSGANGITTYVEDIKPKQTNAIFRNDVDYINKINNIQSEWTAAYQPQFEGMPLEKLIRMSGTKTVTREKRLAHKAHMDRMRPHRELRNTVSVSDFPKEFDWRNVSGVDYVSPVRDQASCGSCYIFAAAGMFEARTRIKSKLQKRDIVSTQEIVSCSDYSQGCDGGFPYLVSKYAEDFGTVREECYPYEGFTGKCKASKCPSEKRDYQTEYKYVGDYYGGSDEASMMKDVYENGPQAVGFEVYRDLMSYRSGVYSHKKTNELDGSHPWEETNHAVLVVGWGELNGVKYWAVKNSWNQRWGNKGYFFIKRGTDECGIESLAVSAVPVL